MQGTWVQSLVGELRFPQARKHLSPHAATIAHELRSLCATTKIGGVCAAKWLQSCPTLDTWTVACQTSCPWDSPGKDTGVDCHFLLQGIFLIQG